MKRNILISILTITVLFVIGYKLFLNRTKPVSEFNMLEKSDGNMDEIGRTLQDQNELTIKNICWQNKKTKSIPDKQVLELDKEVFNEINDRLFVDNTVLMKWQLKPIQSFTTIGEIQNFINVLEITDDKLLTDQQKKKLKETAAKTLFPLFSNSADDYIRYANERGEKLPPSRIAEIEKWLIEWGHMKGSEKKEPNDLVKLFWENWQVQSPWQGLSSEETHFIIYSPDPEKFLTEKTHPGQIPSIENYLPNAEKFRGSKYVYSRRMQPEKKADEVIKNEGKITCANLIFFARNQAERGITIPYVIQFWYNPKTTNWHPRAMTCKIPYSKQPFLIF